MILTAQVAVGASPERGGDCRTTKGPQRHAGLSVPGTRTCATALLWKRQTQGNDSGIQNDRLKVTIKGFKAWITFNFFGCKCNWN